MIRTAKSALTAILFLMLALPALAQQAPANKVWAGPDGAAGLPTYRSLVTGDLPSISSGNVLGNFSGSSAAAGAVTGQEVLSAARDYYVNASTGSDSNDCLSSGAACLTIQHAVDLAAALNCRTYTITINIADGTYTANTALKKPVGSCLLTLTGNVSTPANVIISTTSANGFDADANNGYFKIQGMTITTATTGYGISTTGVGNYILIGANVFSSVPAAYAQLRCSGLNTIKSTANYTISGGGGYHARSTNGCQIVLDNVTITTSGTPAFSGSFANAFRAAMITFLSGSFAGSGATGKRYDATINGLIVTSGSACGSIPGDVAGTTATQGQCI